METLYPYKLENVEVDKFPDAFDPEKLDQEDINHLSRSIT
jgi:hypothetical protein